MGNKFTNTLTDFLTKSDVFYKKWGAKSLISMGDGVRFRVTKSPKIDYVYIRYLDGYKTFDVEFANLVGTEYDIVDRLKPVSADVLIGTISRKLFFN